MLKTENFTSTVIEFLSAPKVGSLFMLNCPVIPKNSKGSITAGINRESDVAISSEILCFDEKKAMNNVLKLSVCSFKYHGLYM